MVLMAYGLPLPPPTMSSLLALLMLVHLALLQVNGAIEAPLNDPTYGFTYLPLNSSNFDIQRPYDLPEGSRYSFVDDIHKLWVLTADKPHSPTSRTNARTEIRIKGLDYSSGVWQFEGHAYVPSGTSGVCIMQVFGAAHHATTLMLRVYDGALMYYKSQVLADDIYEKWFRVNVIHDVGAGQVKVFIDGDLKLVTQDRGGSSHYFKFGVYTQDYTSFFKESRWKGIQVLKLSD